MIFRQFDGIKQEDFTVSFWEKINNFAKQDVETSAVAW